jgi:hypothetical protein
MGMTTGANGCLHLTSVFVLPGMLLTLDNYELIQVGFQTGMPHLLELNKIPKP